MTIGYVSNLQNPFKIRSENFLNSRPNLFLQQVTDQIFGFFKSEVHH